MTHRWGSGSDRVTIVGVLNVTPDSFSDGGRFVEDGREADVDRVVESAVALVDAGADILDVGGESTRPGARLVSVDEEIARTRPVIEAIRRAVRVPISIDTRKAEVADAALSAGAQIVNDVSGLVFDPALPETVARAGAGLVIGHARGTPETMQVAPHYDDPLLEVAHELEASVAIALAAGIDRGAIAIDPGIGFGKRLEDNLALISHCGWLKEKLGLPIWVGPSRKAFLGALTGDPVSERDVATAAACAVAAFCGADAVRVHEPASARRAVAVGRALGLARRKEHA